MPHVSKIVLGHKYLRDSYLGGCSRGKPIRKNHPLEVGASHQSPPGGAAPRTPRFLISACKGHGHAQRPLSRLVLSKATTPRCSPPSLLGLVGEEWVWLRTSEENSCPFLPFSRLAKQQGTKQREAPPASPPSTSRGSPVPSMGSLVGRGHQDAPGVGWGVVPLRTPAQRWETWNPTPSAEDASWRVARLLEGAGQCHARFTHDSRAVIRALRPQKAPRSNKGFGNEGRNTGGRVGGTLVKHPYRIQGKKPGWHRRSH